MSQNEAKVTERYSYRWTDSETLTYTSNYGMETVDSAESGIFDAARGIHQNGLIALTVLNRHSFNIPSTGGVGVTLYVCLGTGVAGWGIWGIASERKRRRCGEKA